MKFFYGTLTYQELNILWKLGQGVPQGAISSPAAFNIFIDDLIKKLNDDLNSDITSAYADDLLSLGELLDSLTNTIEIYLKWADENKMAINKKKSAVMFL